MKNFHRIFGIEFTGNRHDAPLPYLNDIQRLADFDEKLSTGYLAGCHAGSTPSPRAAITEYEIFEALGLIDPIGNPLYTRFEDGVHLNDIAASRYIEDFIAGYEYAAHVETQLKQARSIFRATLFNANAYGLDGINVSDVQIQLKAALGDSLINFRLFTPGTEPKEGSDGPELISLTVDDIISRSTAFIFSSECFYKGYKVAGFESEEGIYVVIDKDVEKDIGQKALLRVLLTVLTTHIAGCIENVMYEQYRASQVNVVLTNLRTNQSTFTKMPNVYK